MGYRLRVWDERTLQRLAAAWRDGVTPRELAERFRLYRKGDQVETRPAAEAGRSRRTISACMRQDQAPLAEVGPRQSPDVHVCGAVNDFDPILSASRELLPAEVSPS